MIDTQSQRDERNISIQKVGVKGLKYPIVVLDRERGTQSANATINMYVSLHHHFKGAHMSRFVEVLNDIRDQISIRTLQGILEKIRRKLHAESAHIEIDFPYFIEKTAPRSRAKSLMEYRCQFLGTLNTKGTDFVVGMAVPVTTVCPCSKEISSTGAHNQRGVVTVKVRFKKFFWIEDVIRLIEASASGEVYSLLKRIDEKFVTEQGYENPMFVEDVVRNVAYRLSEETNFTWYSVEAENFESIHNHSAYAFIEKDSL
ncbi:MAG: GTP cyclohydrolase FolE2 [Syntrophaceae bacterium]|nr:GTP cyclohydrolase FolE2 [Syntrophaceae bacterium]